MILHNRLYAAIIAIYKSSGVFKLCRHGLTVNGAVQVSKGRLHIGDSLIADRTAIRRFGVLGEAFLVNAVAAPHEDYGFRGGEHVVTTYRTVALSGAFNASMCIFN